MLKQIKRWLCGYGPTWEEMADDWQERLYRKGEAVSDYILVVRHHCPIEKHWRAIDDKRVRAFYLGPFGEMWIAFDPYCPMNRLYVIHHKFVRTLQETVDEMVNG